MIGFLKVSDDDGHVGREKVVEALPNNVAMLAGQRTEPAHEVTRWAFTRRAFPVGRLLQGYFVEQFGEAPHGRAFQHGVQFSASDVE
jgi:hypothetical protein